MARKLLTAESVTEGHPDKICDRVADAILDAILAQDPKARVACEIMAAGGSIFVTGEITAAPNVRLDVDAVTRAAIKDIGYTEPATGFSFDTLNVLASLRRQSPDIAQGVDTGGAGDQGFMYGYATNETEVYMPLPILLASRLARRLAEVRKQGTLPYLRPDGKTQVVLEYEGEKAVRVKAVVIATQHHDDVKTEKLREDVRKHVIGPVLGKFFDPKTEVYINQTGRFVIGGPVGDTGLTGRKLVVDAYGGGAPGGGGAFCGKDPTKVDRSAAYTLRWIAKNLVAAGVADRVLLNVAYVIGHDKPIGFQIDAFGTEKVPLDQIESYVTKNFDLTPRGMIKALDLQRPIYTPTAAYGHFGREDVRFPWEELNRVEAIKKALVPLATARAR